MNDKAKTVKDILHAAESAAKAGDTASAIALYSRVLAKLPGHSKAKKALQRLRKNAGMPASLTQGDVDQVVALLRSGQFAAVIQRTGLLLSIAPKEPLLHNIMGMGLSHLGSFKDAVSHFSASIRARPSSGEAHANMGAALLELAEPERAITALQKAVKYKPDFAEAYQNLGTAYTAVSRAQDALSNYEQALSLQPGYVNALNGKGVVLKQLGRLDEAIAAFQAGLAIAPKDADLLTNLSYAYSENNDDEKAVQALEQALKTVPDNAEIWYRLGVQLSQLGRIKAAFAALDQAVVLAPDMAKAYRTMTTLKRLDPNDPRIEKMRTLFNAHRDDADLRMHLGFALGKVAEDARDHETAFAHWRIGNDIRRSGFDYAIAQDQTLVERIKQIFNAQFTSTVQNTTDKPIFVLGMMRSGTTLIEQILASHSQVAGAGEQAFVNRFARRHLPEIATAADFDFSTFAGDYLDCLARIPAIPAATRRIVDKMPINFLWIGLIHAVFPRAIIINMSRDARDICLSIYKTYFDADQHQYAYDLDELAQFYALYHDLMQHWDRVLPGVVYHCSYEAVTQSPEAEIRRLLDHCGLPWEPSVLNFHKSDRVVKTASVSQVRQKVYQSSVANWRNFETALTPLTKILKAAGCLGPEAAR